MICDQCGKKDDQQLEPVQYGGSNAFSGWVRLDEVGTISSINMRTPVNGDFCSLDCVVNYINENKSKSTY